MLAFGIVLALGVGIGLVRGGSFRAVQAARLRALPLVFASLGLQAGAQFVPRDSSAAAFALVVASFVVLFAFAGANVRVVGMGMIAIGAAMNFAVILANQGMPISAEAAARAGYAGSGSELVLRGKHVLDSGQPIRLRVLSDVIPLWRQPAVASAGDLIIWAGMILLIQNLMRGPRGRRARDARPRAEEEHVIDLRDEAGVLRSLELVDLLSRRARSDRLLPLDRRDR